MSRAMSIEADYTILYKTNYFFCKIMAKLYRFYYIRKLYKYRNTEPANVFHDKQELVWIEKDYLWVPY